VGACSCPTAAWGVARSELYPTLAAAVLFKVNRAEDYMAKRFYPKTIADFQVALDLNCMVVDFGAREGRISAARADVLAANLAFNDTHRNVIYRVEQA
jgi:outer membrane protein